MDNNYPLTGIKVLKFPQGNGEIEAMRVKCTECDKKALIQSRNELDTKVADLYCVCSDPLCGHTFVMKLTYSHTLSPSRHQAQQMAVDYLRSLPAAERQRLLEEARQAS